MVIDANMYWLPGKIFEDEDIKRRFLSSSKDFNIYAYEGIVEGSGKSQIIVEKPAGYQNLNYVDGDYMAEKQVEAMDRAGIDKGFIGLITGALLSAALSFVAAFILINSTEESEIEKKIK